MAYDFGDSAKPVGATKSKYDFGDSARPVTAKPAAEVAEKPKTAQELLSRPDYLTELAGGVAEPVLKMATGFLARPVSQVMQMSAAAFGDSADSEHLKGFQEHMQDLLTYHPKTQLGASEGNLLNAIPSAIGKGIEALLVKPMGDLAGGEGTVLGSGTAEATRQALGFVGMKGAPVAKSLATPAAEAAMKGAGKAKDLAKGTPKPETAYRGARDVMTHGETAGTVESKLNAAIGTLSEGAGMASDVLAKGAEEEHARLTRGKAAVEARGEREHKAALDAKAHHLGDVYEHADIGAHIESVAKTVMTELEKKRKDEEKPAHEAMTQATTAKEAAGELVENTDEFRDLTKFIDEKTSKGKVIGTASVVISDMLKQLRAIGSMLTGIPADVGNAMAERNIPSPPPKPKLRSLLSELKKSGVVEHSVARDATGTGKLELSREHIGLGRKAGSEATGKGLGIDGVARWMMENGWLTRAEFEGSVDGGAQAARDKIAQSIDKENPPVHPEDEGAAFGYRNDRQYWDETYGQEVQGLTEQTRLPASFGSLVEMLRMLKERAKGGEGVRGFDAIDVENARTMAEKLQDALVAFHPEYADYLKNYSENSTRLDAFKETMGKHLTEGKINKDSLPKIIFEGADSLRRAIHMVGDEYIPAIQEAARAYASRELEDSARKTASGAQLWIEQNRGWLNEPSMKEVKSSVQAYADGLKKGEAALSGSAEYAKKLQKVADSVLGDKYPDKRMREVLTSGNPAVIHSVARAVRNTAGGKDALMGAARQILSEAKPEGIKKLFHESVRPALEELKLYSPEEMTRLSDMVDEVDKALNTQPMSESHQARLIEGAIKPEMKAATVKTVLGGVAMGALGWWGGGMFRDAATILEVMGGGGAILQRGTYRTKITNLIKEVIDDPELSKLASAPESAENKAKFMKALQERGAK